MGFLVGVMKKYCCLAVLLIIAPSAQSMHTTTILVAEKAPTHEHFIVSTQPSSPNAEVHYNRIRELGRYKKLKQAIDRQNLHEVEQALDAGADPLYRINVHTGVVLPMPLHGAKNLVEYAQRHVIATGCFVSKKALGLKIRNKQLIVKSVRQRAEQLHDISIDIG